jgi:hypothetical protein
MTLSSYAKIGYISVFLFTIPLFSAQAESKAENPKDSFVRLAGFVSRGNVENITKLITAHNKDLQTDTGMSLLHYAVLIEDPERLDATVACLLSHKVAVNLIMAKSTPLDIAEFSCNDSVREMIKKAGGKKYRELGVSEKRQLGVSEKELVSDFLSQFEDETGITGLTNQLIASAKTEKEAVTLCKEYIDSSAKTKEGKQMCRDFALDALYAWARKTGNPKPSFSALDDSDDESEDE